MLRLLIDQDFDHDILRGLIRRVSQLDVVTAHEVEMSEASDPELLAFAFEEGRIILTHDKKTMPNHAADRMNAGENVAGVFVIPRSMPIHQAIDDLELMITCSKNDEWVNIVRYLPF